MDSTIIGKWKWFFVNGCEYKGVISVMTEFLISCQDGRDALVCLGITLQNNDNSAE